MIVLSACQVFPTSTEAIDVLEKTGFGQNQTFLLAQNDKGDVEKNINQDVPALFEVLKKSKVISPMEVTPLYTISMENGSSFDFQVISIDVDASGIGFIEYLGTKTFFSCVDLPTFCSSAFNRSQIRVNDPADLIFGPGPTFGPVPKRTTQ